MKYDFLDIFYVASHSFVRGRGIVSLDRSEYPPMSGSGFLRPACHL